MKLKGFLLTVLSVLSLQLSAGSILKGVVTGEGEDGMVFTFMVTSADSIAKSVMGTIEGNKLNVEIPFSGNVNVKITSLGYDSHISTVNLAENAEYDMGVIALKKNSVKLGEVVVTGKKINVRRDGPDYTISNIQGTHLGNAGNLIDMLSWTPGVVVNHLDESINVVGAGSPIIYVNNRIVRDKSELKMLESTMVNKIEIIRAPGAEYSSSTAAVIKIYTSRPLKDYLGISLTNESMIQRNFSNDTRLNVNMKTGMVSGNFSVSYGKGKGEYYDWEKTEFLQSDGSMFKTSDYGENAYKLDRWNVFGGLNFQLGKKSVLGVQYSGSFANNDMNETGTKKYNEGNKLIEKGLSAVTNSDNKSHVASLSYVWQHAKNSTLTLVADYSNKPGNTEKLSIERNFTDGGSCATNVNTSKKYDIYTFDGGYTFSFAGKDKEKIGVAFYHVKSDAGTAIGDYTQGSLRKDTWLSAYWTFKRSWKKWKVELGLRYEYDNISNDSYADAVNIKKTYSDILPTLRASYTFNKDFQMTAIYRRVISRPGYQELDPTVYYSDSLNYSTGNPLLKPTFTDRYRLIFNVKSVTISAQYWRYKNEVINVLSRKAPDSNIYVSRPENISNSDAWMLDVDYSLSANKLNIALHGGLVLPYLKYPYLDENRKVNKLFGSVYANVSYMFTRNFFVFAQGTYRTQSDSGITRNATTCNINAGAMLMLLNNNLKISVVGTDLLHKSVSPWWETKYGNMTQWHKNSYDTRGVVVKVSYTLNDLKTKFINRGGSSSAYSRTN